MFGWNSQFLNGSNEVTSPHYFNFTFVSSQWIFQVPVKGGRDYITP